MSWISDLFSKPTIERPSPKIRITQGQAIAIFEAIRQVRGYEDCYLAAIDVTNSMEPGIDDSMFVILKPTLHTDLIVGDIIYYEAPSYKAIHRIILIGDDNQGWYCETKGDNNGRKDGIKVRPEHIKGVWRATLN